MKYKVKNKVPQGGEVNKDFEGSFLPQDLEGKRQSYVSRISFYQEQFHFRVISFYQEQ